MISLCSPVAVAEKRLMDVKLGELGSWIGSRDFTPNGIIAAIRRGKERLKEAFSAGHLLMCLNKAVMQKCQIIRSSHVIFVVFPVVCSRPGQILQQICQREERWYWRCSYGAGWLCGHELRVAI